MINFQRVCVPLSLDCNLNCKYCYRSKEKLDRIPVFNQKMIDYLGSLSPDKTEAVIASGGEPLLHFDKVKELFSYVPKNVHKKIMTNGTLLTQEIVDYINDNKIELLVSYDGSITKFLRGVDILEDENLVNLIRQIKILVISSVVTKYNTNIWENYFDTVKKLKRIDFEYQIHPIEDVVPEMEYLVNGFNYDEWFKTYSQFRLSPFYSQFPWYKGKTLNPKYRFRTSQRGVGFNVLPDGTITGMIRICSIYGTVYESTIDECKENAFGSGLLDYCIKTKCKYTDKCDSILQHTSYHSCKCKQILMDKWTDQYVKDTKMYLKEHLNDIIKKYFSEFFVEINFDKRNM